VIGARSPRARQDRAIALWRVDPRWRSSSSLGLGPPNGPMPPGGPFHRGTAASRYRWIRRRLLAPGFVDREMWKKNSPSISSPAHSNSRAEAASRSPCPARLAEAMPQQ